MNILKRIFKPNLKYVKDNQCVCCFRYKMYGRDLIFISRIERKGEGTVDVSNTNMSHLDNDLFDVDRLSITNGTYIAHGFNSYVVKLRS